jgi:hypothetical protein
LSELWQGLRVSPVYGEAGQPARWELLRVRHRDALATATSTSQVTALSLLVSMYLQSVYAASSEEIEVFLSPLASRSRVREAVRGLAATRQIHSLSMDAQTYYFLEGGLPEFAGLVAPPTASTEPLARVETPQRPLTAQRSDRPARPMRPASPAARPAKPAAFTPRPGPAPSSGAARAPARREWTGPRRSSGKPAATGANRPERDAGKRPSRPQGRSFPPRTTAQPGKAAGIPRPGARPDTRRDRPAAAGWTGGKRERPAAWTRPGARPGEGSASTPRPPYSGDRSHSPFREGQQSRPKRGPGSEPGRRPGGDRAPGKAPGRPSSGRPQHPEGFPARAGGIRPWAAKRPPAAGRTQGRPPVPFRSNPGGSGSAGPRADAPRPERPRSGIAQGAKRGPAGGSTSGSDRRSYDRPRSGGYGKPGGPSGASPKSERRDQGPRPPFTPGTRPSKSWPRASARPGGRPGGKAGKPPARFQGSKPKGKKPGA